MPICAPRNMPKRYSRPMSAPLSRPKRSPTRSPKSPSPSVRRKRCVTRNALLPRHAQRRGQRRDVEVRLRVVDRDPDRRPAPGGVAARGFAGAGCRIGRRLGGEPAPPLHREQHSASSGAKRADHRMDLRPGLLGVDDQRPLHVFVAVAAVLGAENLESPRRRGHEIDRHRLVAARDELVDLEFLDLEAVHAVTGLDDEPHALAFGDLDARRLEREPSSPRRRMTRGSS